jgi:hypothetical protein
MKISKLVLGLFPVALALSAQVSSASAQSVPSDVRCLLLSNLFSKKAEAEPARQAAAQSLIFYLGRLDGRVAPRALEAAMRAQSNAIDPKAAGPEMATCAARLVHAQQTVQALGRAAAPAK